jgi:hypothetical protein
MFRVDDIWDEARKIIGICDEPKFFRLIGDAASLIVNKADLEGLKGTLDICSAGCNCSGQRPCGQGCGRRCLTMPAEVQTVIGVNIGGRPALGYGQLFNHHQNGPGDCRQSCEFSWQDMGAYYVTFRDILTPAQLVVYTATPEDNNKQFIVYGYDSNGNVLRRQVAGVWQNGLAIPTIYGAAIPEENAPLVARITGLYKEPSVGSMRLSTIDDSGATGVLLGIYEPDQTTPQFRRLQLNRACNWARVSYLKPSPLFTSRYDHIPLMSRRGFLLAVQAVKLYTEQQLGDAHQFEADAARLEVEAQNKLDAPLYFPLQFVDRNSLRDKGDYWLD